MRRRYLIFALAALGVGATLPTLVSAATTAYTSPSLRVTQAGARTSITAAVVPADDGTAAVAIFAPRGTGILWVPEKNWGRIRPTIPTFYDVEPFAAWEDERRPNAPKSISWISPGGFKAFEHQWAMAEAFEFHQRIGRKRIADRIAALNTQCKEGLAKIPKVKLLTPKEPALSAGLIAFEVEGQSASETVHKPHAKKVVASSSPYKISKARLAPSLVNDEREVEAALRAVREIA